MASGGAEEDDGDVPMDTDNVHMLLQGTAECEQVQKRTVTTWMNAQMAETPVVLCNDVRSKAQSMARGRLEKARVRLQEHIQCAIMLFGGKEISQTEAKKKERALTVLQPLVLQEFLDAVEALGAFCSEAQLQDLMLHSDSVRKQWEDVCREMAAFFPMLWSKVREDQSCSAVQSQTHTNTLLEATDRTDHACSQGQQDVPTDREDQLAQHGEQHPKPSLPAREQRLKAPFLLMADSSDGALSHTQSLCTSPISQAVVRSDADETKQPAEWTVIPKLVKVTRDTSRQQGEAERQLERHSWQGAMQQRLQPAGGQSESTDRKLTHQEVLTSLHKHASDMETKLIGSKHTENKDEINPAGHELMQRDEDFSPVEVCPTEPEDASSQQGAAQAQQHLTSSGEEGESVLEAARSKLDGESETKMQREGEHRVQTWWTGGGDVEEEQGRSRMEGLVQRRDALLEALREIKGAAEQLRLHEPTLPAVQQRTRALTELDSRLAGLLSELRHIRAASSSGVTDMSQSDELEDAWEETTKDVTFRLEQCCVVTELLKRFQCVRAELSGTLQAAERTISEQASHMAKDNLLRLYSKVKERKAELKSLGVGIEEVRSVCRQLHTHLRQTPGCSLVPFQSEADALMDGWLDISERTDSHLESLQLALTLWDGVLQLGAEVEKWTGDRIAVFAETPSFQSEDDIQALQNEIVAQEKSVERFQQRAIEIQSLLHSSEPPLELQVAETQMRKKLEQLKELLSEAEEVFWQTVAAEGQMSARTAECFRSLGNIRESLLSLGGTDAAVVLAKLQDLGRQLQIQDQLAESLLEDLHVLTSISSHRHLQNLSAQVLQLQEGVRASHQLFSEVEEQTRHNIQDLDRLQSASVHLEQWLHIAEDTAEQEEDLLQEEVPQLRVRTEVFSQPLSSLQSSNIQRVPPVDESRRPLERYNTLHTPGQHFQVGDQSPHVDSPLRESPSIQSPEEQRRHHVQDLEEDVKTEERFGQLLQDCCHKLTSLQERLSACQAQTGSSARLFAHNPASEELLQEASALEKDIVQLVTLKDLIADRLTVEAEANVSRQISKLQHHKRALDSSIRESLAPLSEDSIQKVKVEISCVETAVKNLAENIASLSVDQEELPDLSQLKQQRCTIQDFENRLMELAAAIHSLQRTGGSNVMRAMLPADVTLNADGAVKDFDSLRSTFRHKKHQCAENTAHRVREVVRQLQHWNQTVQAEPSPCSQAALDEGLQLQKHLRDVLSDTDLLLNVLGAHASKELEEHASHALSESTRALESLSQRLVAPTVTYNTRAGHSPPCSPSPPHTVSEAACDANLTDVSSPEENPALLSKLIGPKADERDSTKLSEPRELTLNVSLSSSKPNGTCTECQTTFHDVKQEVTGSRQSEKETVSSGLCAAGSSLQTSTETAVADETQLTGADGAESAREELTAGRNAIETGSGEGLQSKHPEELERRDNMTPLNGAERDSVLPASLEATQRQTLEGTEPERTPLPLSADPGLARERAAPDNHRPIMQDIFEIQSLVERSNIINRTPHIDLNWYLKSSPGEPQIRLVRTVQRVLACRYQPAQLDLTAMIKQLEEAEEYRSRVQELIATTKSTSAAMGCDPDASERAARQCREALLDASATVQVKAAQLDQVKRFHNQMRMTRAFLEVVAAEKEKLSLDTLGSSAAQADKFTALLQTMALKKHMMEELLHLSGQFSVHLSDAESSGALLAQLGDVQEEWRLLEGSIKRALRHATNSTAQASVLIKEAEELHVKLEELQKSSLQGNDSKSALELVCLTTDLKLYNQLFLYLTSQSNALVHFSLGQKEKDKIQTALQELGSLLDVTKRKLDSCNCSCAAVSSARMNKQLQDLIIWAKQAENHVSTGRKLALFPEEARNQIVDMRKFQTDILSRRSKMKAQVEEMKEVACDTEKEESDQILKTIEDLYEAIADSLDHVLDNMKKQLQVREKLLSQLDSLDAWLAESHTTRDAYGHVDNVSKADMQTLESELESRRLASVEIQRQLEVVETMEESCKDIAAGLSPGESRYLVNRLSGLWTGLDGLLAHEKATSWELEELIHERTSSQKELSTIRSSLKQISTDLEQQRFPLTRETLLTVARVMHMLMENQCQVQELQHCQEAERSALLCAIGDLQEKCKALSLSACEQDKYLHLRRQVEESRDIVKEQMQRARDETLKVGERFRLCQTLLVEVPLVKTQCQEAGDQLEAVAQDLLPSELNSERQRIRHVVETLVSWEHSVTEDVRGLEAQLLPSLRFSGELSAFMDLLQRTKEELEAAKPVSPEEKEVDCALRRCWVLWRNTQSGMRVLEALGQEDKINLKDHKELYSLRDAVMEACHLQMESLSQARESLKDYQWAAQGAISFLHHAEATFLSAPGGFLDCTEELRQTQQALEALEEGLQAHICHLVELFPQRPRLSQPACEQLHISILSQLLVGRSVLEAQAQLRLESLQGCAVRQQSHRSCHEDIRQRLSGFEARLQECAAAHVTSHDKCVAQQKTAARLMEDLRRLAGKTEELRAGCPMQGCGVGKDGELGALWRRWVSLRRGVGLLMAHAEQRQEEWKDITTSLQQCCSLLANLQAEVPDSSAVSFTQENPQDLLAHAEVHQASLEQEQQALASLEHRLEHALSLSTSQGPISPGPVGKTLVKIQDNIRSLKERNLLVVAAAQAEEKERQRVQEEIGALEKHMFAILPKLEACSEPSQQQELREDLSSHQAKLKCIMDDVQSRYAEIPADISKSFQEAQRSLQRVEEELAEGSSPARKLAGRVSELGSGLEKVQALLEQKSPTVSEAQNVLKRVWDELDSWRSRLMLLESEVQDLAEEKPDQAHLLMDHLTQPLQLYQNTSQMVESRTSFVSKIPACLQEFEDILYSATCWLDEAQAWLSAPCSFTTARSLQSHAKSLQLVLDDSERIGDMLQDFRPVLAEISSVCDVSAQEDRLDQNDQRVHKMQRVLLEPLEQLLQAAVVVQTMENELKTMEKNVSKIRTILSSMDDSNITPSEHHRNRQVILANVQSIRGTLEDMERCKGELRLPQGADENMVVFSQARQLLQRLEELDRLTRYQVSLLENKIRMEEENRKEQDVSSVPEATQSQDTQRRVQQEPFDVSNSEEEEDEDDESCHSSSSDTLTCSIPEDPEETLVLPDVKSENVDMMPLSSVKELKSSADSFSSEVEMSSESGLLSVKPVSDTNDFTNAETGSTAVEAHVDGSTCPEALRAELVISGVTPEAEDLCGAADTQDRHDESLQPAAAASEETRLIPTRPITPFMAAAESAELITEEDEALTLSTAPHQHVDTFHVSEEQSDASHKVQESSKVQFSLGGHEEEEKDHLRWSGLNTQVSQKLTTLKKVQQEYQSWSGSEVGGGHEKAPDKELTSTGSAAAVLQCTQESITMLRKIASADCSRPHVREELYEAVWRILLSLDAWTDFLQTGEEDLHLRMLQQECVSSELTTLAELLNKVESEIRPVLLKEEPEALCSLTCLEDCLSTVQLLFTSSLNQLSNQLGLEKKPQFFYQLCLLDDFDLGHSETNTSLKDAPSLEQRVLGKHLRGSSGGKAKLQPATQALLQGITHLLELGEESIKERQMSQVHNLGQLQDVLCRRKVLLLVLGSQLAFLQHLFRREPEALRCQEAERLQLEVRAKALQQQALGQEVASQRSLREWILWEDSRGRLVRMLDEFEALVSTGEPEGDATQQRLNNLQKTQVQLDEGRAALGLFLDQCKVPQTEPVFTGSVRQAGVALELRWRGALRRTEQEIQRCRDVQEIQARFHTDSASLSDWLLGANKRLKSWSEPNQECVGDCLLQLLDFSMKVEAMSQQKASVSRRASQLLHLREADCPGLRSGITQLEVTWDRVTSDLAKIQDQLHQQLIADWPPVELLSDLEVWLKKLEAALSRETETSHKAKDAAQITEILQHYQVLKAGVVSGQLLLDFLCQSGPQAAGADVQALRSERTAFAETLGRLRLQLLHVQEELETQIRGAEQMRHTCAVREKQLKRRHGWIMQQKEQLDQWERPTSQTLVRTALTEWQAVGDKLKEVAAAVQTLKATQVHVDEEEKHPCDILFSNQAQSVIHVCEDLCQQMEVLRPALQQTDEKWICFDMDLQEATLRAAKVHCALQHHRAPLFSPHQAEGYRDFLQELQGEADKGQELWAAVEKSCLCLVKTVHCGTAKVLSDRVEGEKTRWTDTLRELKDEHVKTGETVSMWQEYRRLFDDSSLRLQHIRLQWEELLSSLRSSERDTPTMVQSVETLQDVAEKLKSSIQEVLEASRPLSTRLEPLASNLVQSETRLLSCDVQLLVQVMSARKKSLQEEVDDQKLFRTRLQTLEKQTQIMKDKLAAGIKDKDSLKQVLSELSDLFPSLVDVRDMRRFLTLNKQEAEELHVLCRDWSQITTHTCDTIRELQAEHQSSQSFQEKRKNLVRLKEELVEESTSQQPESHHCLTEILSVHQRLQAKVVTGHQLLQGLLCDAVTSTEGETGERRSETVAQVSSMKEAWFNAVRHVDQCRSLAKEKLRQHSTYHHGLKLLWKLLREVDPLLPPAGPAPCALSQLQSRIDDYQCVEEALDLHSAVYNQTLEAGKHLTKTTTQSECQLQSELQAIEEAWKRTTSLLESRKGLVEATLQKWCRCQEGITSIMSDLNELKTKVKQQLHKRPENKEFIQETELSLLRLASGLRDLGTMKTDLSHYMAATDSALLEQQLEQLQAQWEELCMKVSLRRQEISDHLNAWTIFNDKNKEFCDWLTQTEKKVCHSGDLSIEEMVEKLKKDCMEEINLFSENKSHLKQLGEQLLLASDEAKQTQVHGSLQEVNQRWHNVFHHIEARVKKLTETLVTVQQLDKNMSNLRSWLSRMEAELFRPITYSVCHHQEIQRRLAEQQELQQDIEQHTEGVASVLSLCDVLLCDEDAAGGVEAESDSLQETSRCLDRRWRTICAMALDRRLRIEETWRLWCKFLDDYSRFEDWLKMAESTAANPNSAGVLYTVAKEELKKFEGFQRQVHERLTQLEIVNNQYRRLARENRTDRASQLKAMVHEGNWRWDTLHRRVAAILRRLKYFTSQREEFEGTRESMLVWLTQLDLQLTNVEHFSESDVHHKIQQLNSFQKEITLNTERIDGLIVFGEGLIQRSSPHDAALIEDELEELHTYCQEVFSRLVRFHQRLSQPPMVAVEPKLPCVTFSLESSLELIGRPWLGRGHGSLPATPTHLLASPLERSGCETPVSVDSLPLEWDHTGDVGGSSTHEDEDDEEEHEEEGTYFSTLSAPSRSMVVPGSPLWGSRSDTGTHSPQLDSEGNAEAAPKLTSTPLKQGYLGLTSQCTGSIEDIKRVSLILDDDERTKELGLTGLTASDKQSGVIERWELLQAQSRSNPQADGQEHQQLTSDLDDLTSWLDNAIPQLDRLQLPNPTASIADMESRARELKEMQRMFTHYKSIMLSVNLRAQAAPDLQEKLASVNAGWSRVCTGLQQWDISLRTTLTQCKEFHETLHSLLLWLAHAESRRYAVDISNQDTPVRALQQHRNTLTDLQEELWSRETQQASLQALWSQLRPDTDAEDSEEAQEKLHVTGSKLKLLLREVDQDLSTLQQQLSGEAASDVKGQPPPEVTHTKKDSSTPREMRASPPPRSFFYRVLRAAFPLHLLLLLLLLLPCLIPLSESHPSCTVANNFARSFYPMLHYTNGPPPT